MGITSELKVLFVFIATLIIIWKSAPGVHAQGYDRDGRYRDGRNYRAQAQDYNDGALMAHTIGSAGLNTEYYFNTLGVACENKAGSLYRTFKRYAQNCTAEVSLKIQRASRGRFNRPSYSSGSLEGFCDNWEDNKRCKKEHAKDLDVCLGEPKGSEAYRFMDSFAKYTCTSTREASSHLTDRPNKYFRSEPGVFKCFESTQDRIVNCVKDNQPPMPFCSWFSIVEQCFAKFYNRESCDDPSTLSYINNLFRTMSADLRCPLTSDLQRQDYHYDNRDQDSQGWGWQPSTTPNPPAIIRGGWQHEDKYHPILSPPTARSWGSAEHSKLNHYDYYDTVWKQPHLRPWEDPLKDQFDLYGPLPTRIPDYNDRYTSTRKSPSSRRKYRENVPNRLKVPTTTKAPINLDDKLIYIPVSADDTNENFATPSSSKNFHRGRDEISSTTPFYLKPTSDESATFIALGHRVSARSTTFGPYSTVTSVQFQVQTPEEETTTKRKRRFRKVRRTTTSATTPGPLVITEVTSSSQDDYSKIPPSVRVG